MVAFYKSQIKNYNKFSYLVADLLYCNVKRMYISCILLFTDTWDRGCKKVYRKGNEPRYFLWRLLCQLQTFVTVVWLHDSKGSLDGHHQTRNQQTGNRSSGSLLLWGNGKLKSPFDLVQEEKFYFLFTCIRFLLKTNFSFVRWTFWWRLPLMEKWTQWRVSPSVLL